MLSGPSRKGKGTFFTLGSVLPSNHGNIIVELEPIVVSRTLMFGQNHVRSAATVSSQAHKSSLCAAHHLVGVSASKRSNTATRCSDATCSSICTTNLAVSIIPSNHGRVVTSAPIHLHACRATHHRVEFSYSPFCLLVNAASESIPKEHTLHQLHSPSVVGLM
jgi:hypothetical protein|nr:hypothetical protein Q903MT_gene4399 [Picea sitchensis]